MVVFLNDYEPYQEIRDFRNIEEKFSSFSNTLLFFVVLGILTYLITLSAFFHHFQYFAVCGYADNKWHSG